MKKGYLRAAFEEDMDLLFEWANETAVRENSFSTSAIEYEEHKTWYQKILVSEDCRQYIYMYDSEPVGQVRVFISGVTAEVGYSICVSKRGMGHGKNMLHLLKERVKHEFPEIQRLTAKVKPGNKASQKVFLDEGYQEQYRYYELDI